MPIRYRYTHRDRDRHGTERVYFWRRPGPKVRMHEEIGSPEFAQRYADLLAGNMPQRETAPRIAAGTFGWLVEAWIRSPDARRLDADTLRARRVLLLGCCREPVAPGRPEVFEQYPLTRLDIRALRVLRDRKAAAPEAGNNRVRALRGLFRWAAAERHVPVDIARHLERLAVARGGHRTWTSDDIAKFEARHPVGTRARLALALLLYTGMRRSDVVEFGRQHVRDVEIDGQRVHWVSKREYKGRARYGKRIEIPMLPDLAAIIAGSPTGDLAYLVTERGRPFSTAGFGNWFRDRCDEAGLRGLAAHGLRKAGATALAERGATAHQLMAIYGWRTLAEAELYTRAAERKRLAISGMALLNVPTAATGGNDRRKNTAKSM